MYQCECLLCPALIDALVVVETTLVRSFGALSTSLGAPRPTITAMEAAERFAHAAKELGIEPAVQRFPEGTRTAADAASAVGCEIGQIVKSLVFVAGPDAVLVLTSGANRVDEALAAAALGMEALAKADAALVREATGFAIGGTPPFGHVGRLRTVVDADLMGWSEVWAAAGTPDTCFPIAPADLVRFSGGVVADVAAR